MKHLISLRDWDMSDVQRVFELADAFHEGQSQSVRGSAVLFFPSSSIRTRVTFEMACARLGLQPILFPPETLAKKEDPRDVMGYLANWVDVVVARFPSIDRLREFAGTNTLPVVNAMTDTNHPCEMLADLYSLRQRHPGWQKLSYLFVGADGNIGRGWAEAAALCDLDLKQACPAELSISGVERVELTEGLADADVILTDGVGPHREALAPYRVTGAMLDKLPDTVLLNPCPPFDRTAEIDAAAADNPRFVGYDFKAVLLPVQQAIIQHCLRGDR